MAEEKPSARRRDASGRFASKEEIEAEDRENPDAAAGETGEHETAERETGELAGEHEPDEREARGGRDRDADSSVEDISDITAPSIGPGSTVEREPVEVRLARHEQSEVDAMGQDKRRQVVGKTYGPTLARQAALYGIFLVVIVAIGFGIKLAVDHFDQPPKHFAAEAPWAQKGVKQIKPKPLQ